MQKILIKIILQTLSIIPLRLNHLLGAGLGYLLYLIPNRTRQVTTTNIQRCFPELTKSQQKQMICETLKHSGKTLTELGPLWHWSLTKLQAKVRQVDNAHLLEQGAQSNRGVLCLTPHYGCWELTSLYFADLYPAVCLYRPPRQKAIADYIKSTRERFGTTLIPTTAAGIKNLYLSLGQGKTVGLLPDQDPGKNKGIYTSFFGIPCNTMPLFAKLIRKTQPIVLFIYATRLDKGRGYHISLEALDYDLKTMDNQQILQLMNQTIERQVKKMPAQYQWTYKLFKYQPDNTRFYK